MTDSEPFARSRAVTSGFFKCVLESKAHAHAHRLPMIVISRPTKDHPGKWLVRLWYSLPSPTASDICFAADSHEKARDLVPAYMTMLARDPNDDPVIEEVWL